jgi:hypothetical protein
VTGVDPDAVREYTAGVEAARNEYAEHPTAACAWFQVSPNQPPCQNLARDGDTLCYGCRRKANAAAGRSREYRARKREGKTDR